MPFRKFFRKLFGKKKVGQEDKTEVRSNIKKGEIPPAFAGKELERLQRRARENLPRKKRSELGKALTTGEPQVIRNVLSRIIEKKQLEEVPTIISSLESLNEDEVMADLFPSRYGPEEDERQTLMVTALAKLRVITAIEPILNVFRGKGEYVGGKISAAYALSVLIPMAIREGKISEGLRREVVDEIVSRVEKEILLGVQGRYELLRNKSQYLVPLALLDFAKFSELIISKQWLGEGSQEINREIALSRIQDVVKMAISSKIEFGEFFWKSLEVLTKQHGISFEEIKKEEEKEEKNPLSFF